MTFSANLVRVALDNALKPVGDEAFRIIYKALSDGLPSGGIISEAMWQTEYVGKHLTDDEANKIARLALRIEEEAKLALVSLLANDNFRDALKRDFILSHSRKNAKSRQSRRTAPFIEILKLNPNLSTKEIVNKLEQEGKIIDQGDKYEIVTSGAIVKKDSIASKVSRIRKKMRNV
jgi:hypothetical protein